MEGTARERKREQFNYSIIETLIWVFSIRMYISWRICLFFISKARKIRNNIFISYQLTKEIKEK